MPTRAEQVACRHLCFTSDGKIKIKELLRMANARREPYFWDSYRTKNKHKCPINSWIKQSLAEIQPARIGKVGAGS